MNLRRSNHSPDPGVQQNGKDFKVCPRELVFVAVRRFKGLNAGQVKSLEPNLPRSLDVSAPRLCGVESWLFWDSLERDENDKGME